MMTVFRLVLLVGLVLCAIATALVKKPMQAVIIYMAYSVMMSVVWILLQSPDLAITEAAVGAGITSILFFLTLRRINLIGTLVVIAISILTYLLGEDYLADIAVVYVVLSFIAVAMLCRIYINLYDRRKEETQDDR